MSEDFSGINAVGAISTETTFEGVKSMSVKEMALTPCDKAAKCWVDFGSSWAVNGSISKRNESAFEMDDMERVNTEYEINSKLILNK